MKKAPEDIRIIINGFPEIVPGNISVSQLIGRFGEGDSDLIVEHNGRFIYPD